MEFLTCWCSFKVCNQKCVYFLHDLPPCTDFCECEECNNTKRDDKNDFDALVEEQEKCLLWYNYSDNSECKYISLIQFYFFLYFFFFFFFLVFYLFLLQCFFNSVELKYVFLCSPKELNSSNPKFFRQMLY